MTDRFEEAVRDAARGLGAPGDLPSYHDAYRRGTRRRFVKRSVLAAAGALVVVAALTVNVQLPGNDSSETDDVVVGIDAATPTPADSTPPTSVPTTAPVETPDPTVQATPQTIPTAEPSAAPTPEPTEPAAVATTPPATAAPQPTAPPAEPTPTAEQAPVEPTAPPVEPTPEPTAFVLEVAPTPTPEPFVLPSPTEVADGSAAGTAEAPDVATLQADDEPPPEVASTTLVERPDATIVDETAGPGGLDCDVDQDGTPDAACSLLGDYPCTGSDDVRPGYSVFDDDEDGAIDTCRAVGLTMCDTTGDGFPDTPCVIELDQAVPTPGE